MECLRNLPRDMGQVHRTSPVSVPTLFPPLADNSLAKGSLQQHRQGCPQAEPWGVGPRLLRAAVGQAQSCGPFGLQDSSLMGTPLVSAQVQLARPGDRNQRREGKVHQSMNALPPIFYLFRSYKGFLLTAILKTLVLGADSYLDTSTHASPLYRNEEVV